MAMLVSQGTVRSAQAKPGAAVSSRFVEAQLSKTLTLARKVVQISTQNINIFNGKWISDSSYTEQSQQRDKDDDFKASQEFAGSG
jgi:hypothetical protein